MLQGRLGPNEGRFLYQKLKRHVDCGKPGRAVVDLFVLLMSALTNRSHISFLVRARDAIQSVPHMPGSSVCKKYQYGMEMAGMEAT